LTGAGDFHAGQKSRRRQKHADENLAAPKTRRHKNTPVQKSRGYIITLTISTQRQNPIPLLPKSREPKITLKSRKFGFHKKKKKKKKNRKWARSHVL
jgi:hypothetical protein